MSIELYLVTDRDAKHLHLSEQLPFGGKVICAVLWQILIPEAKGRSGGGNVVWSRWHEDFRQSMGSKLESFLDIMSRTALLEQGATMSSPVPIQAFYSEMTIWYRVLTDMNFRRRHPEATLELIPDVLAVLNLLESEITAGAKFVVMGAE
jgi:hypothetical protein